MEVNDALIARYTLRTESVFTRPGCWNYRRCEVLDDGEKIGEYVYRYDMTPPWHPFEKSGRHFALYATDYTATRIMELPSCRDLGGETGSASGFCPVNFAVPFGTYCCQDHLSDDDPQPRNPRHDPANIPRHNTPEYEEEVARFDEENKLWELRHPWVDKAFDAEFGFVCGCVWGDDSSWKIEYLDLSRAAEGIVARDSRLGYIEMFGGGDTLKDCIDIESWEPGDQIIKVATMQWVNLAKPVEK